MTSPPRAGHPPGPDHDTVRARPGMPGGRTASHIRMLAPAPEQPISAGHQETHPKGRQAAQIYGSAGGYQILPYQLPADEDLLDLGHRPVGVKVRMAEARQVTQAVMLVHRQEQAGAVRGERGRMAAAERDRRGCEGLRQPGGQVRGRLRMADIGVPNLAPRIAHRCIFER